MTELAATAREILDGTMYMVLGTADESERPWVSPVYFRGREYSDFWSRCPMHNTRATWQGGPR